jgi:hypothetical protein
MSAPTGKLTAQLLASYSNGNVLSDEAAKDLLEGLRWVSDFHRTYGGARAQVFYLEQQFESVERICIARNLIKS